MSQRGLAAALFAMHVLAHELGVAISSHGFAVLARVDLDQLGVLVACLFFSHSEWSLEASGGEDGHVHVGDVVAAHRRIARLERVIYMSLAVAFGGALVELWWSSSSGRGVSASPASLLYTTTISDKWILLASLYFCSRACVGRRILAGGSATPQGTDWPPLAGRGWPGGGLRPAWWGLATGGGVSGARPDGGW